MAPAKVEKFINKLNHIEIIATIAKELIKDSAVHAA